MTFFNMRLSLLLCALFFLVGCATMTIDACYDDEVCTPGEILKGCNDCLPDLVAGDDLVFAHSEDGLEVATCIVNVGGPLHSQIPVEYTAIQNGETLTFSKEVSFNSLEHYTGIFDLDFLDNEIVFSGVIRRDIEEKTCFSHFLEIDDLDTQVTLHINPEKTIREKEYKNNDVTTNYGGSSPTVCSSGYSWSPVELHNNSYLADGCWGVCQGELSPKSIIHSQTGGFNLFGTVDVWEYVMVPSNGSEDETLFDSNLSGCQFTCQPSYEWDGTQCVESCIGCDLLEIVVQTSKSQYAIGEQVRLE